MRSIIDAHLEQIQELCRRHHVRRLLVFGSVLRDDFDPQTSDIDFLVEFNDLREGQHADTYFDLLEALQTALQRKIDLVMAGAVKNPYIKQAIESSQEILYAA